MQRRRAEWVGARVTLPLYITEGEPYRPEAVIWLELPSGLIIGWTLIDPEKPASFTDTLREAMRHPHAGTPRRPARIRVADERLAAEVRSALAVTTGLAETTEIVVAPTPEIDELVRLLIDGGIDDTDDASALGPGWFSVPFEMSAPGRSGAPAEARPAGRAYPPAAAARPLDAGHVGRNDPCPCGSGKKYKRCHLRDAAPAPRAAPAHARDRQLASEMTRYASARLGDAWLRFQDAFDDAEATAMLSVPWALYHSRVRGRTVAQWFLDERGGRLAPADREWIEAQARAWLGVWEVRDARPGESLDLEDLLTGERRQVREASASRDLHPREAILARVVDHEGLSLLCGVHPHPLPPLDAAEVVRVMRARLRRGRRAPTERLRDEALGSDLIVEWEATVAALVERLKVPPQVRNTDGDELVFTTDRYEFERAGRPEIEELLAGMEGVSEPEEDEGTRDHAFFQRSADRPSGLPTVTGWARVGDGVLTVETNSLRRADALRERLETRFGERLRHVGRERKDTKAMLDAAWAKHEERAASGARDTVDECDAASPEAQQALREIKEQHYADWADRPLPALGGRTARRAVRTKDGRDQVDALLKGIEHREARLPAAERFDVSALRRALGL